MAEWDGITAQLEELDPEDDLAFAKKRIRFWLGKIVVFPIGERWLAISVTAAVGGALFTFTVLPILALISMLWVYKVRIAKTLAMAKTRIQSRIIARQLDLGITGKAFLTRFDWLEPSLLRALELGVLIALFAFTGNLSGELGIASFVVLFSIAFHHYDNLYRAMQGEQKPKWLAWMGLTIVGRIAVVALAATGMLEIWLLSGYFGTVLLLGSSIQWVYARKSAESPGSKS
jgi:hypothetical protein